MNTVTVSPKFQVVIPKAVREALVLVPGQRLQVLVIEGRIELAGTAAEIVSSDKARAIYLGEKFRL